jgi:hypothetical protein
MKVSQINKISDIATKELSGLTSETLCLKKEKKQ